MNFVAPSLVKEADAILRSDYRKIASIYGDTRSAERILAHYRLERRLADEMRHSTRTEREQGLYAKLYDALLGELEDHPRKRPVTEAGLRRRERYVQRQVRMILSHVDAVDTFLEVGGGDCEVVQLVAPHVLKAIVVDVTEELAPNAPMQNFEFVKTSAVALPLADASVSFAYSNQVMEHLHPDDAVDQLNEIFRVLKPGGKYLCRTPSQVTGPHDVSRYFDDASRGTHMHEYSYAELDAALSSAGFVRRRIVLAPRAYYFGTMPRFVGFALEKLFAKTSRVLHTTVCRSPVVRALMGVTMLAQKPL